MRRRTGTRLVAIFALLLGGAFTACRGPAQLDTSSLPVIHDESQTTESFPPACPNKIQGPFTLHCDGQQVTLTGASGQWTESFDGQDSLTALNASLAALSLLTCRGRGCCSEKPAARMSS